MIMTMTGAIKSVMDAGMTVTGPSAALFIQNTYITKCLATAVISGGIIMKAILMLISLIPTWMKLGIMGNWT